MDFLKKNRRVIEDICMATIPTVLIYFFTNVLFKDLSIIFEAVISLCSYSLTLFIIFIYRIKCFRRYREFEGKWIEIIPNSNKFVSICELYHDANGYHFKGFNYGIDENDPVEFDSLEFIPHTNTEFFYITESNLSLRPEGYGKVYSLSLSDKGYRTATGYFFDVSNAKNPKIYRTHMIKFEKEFYDNELEIRRNLNPEKFSFKQIYDNVKPFVQSYIENNVNSEVLL